MLISGNVPRLEYMALRAVTTEAFEVRVPAIVASGTIERLERRLFIKLIRLLNFQPSLKRFERGTTIGVLMRSPCECSGADPGEFHVVQHQWPRACALMLGVTWGTLLNTCMKRSWLAPE